MHPGGADPAREKAIAGERPRIVLLDRPSAWALRLHLVRHASAIWYFDGDERIASAPARWIRPFVAADPQRVNVCVGDVRDRRGASVLHHVHTRARRLAAIIREREIMTDPLVHAFGSMWPASDIGFYLERLVEVTLRRELARIAVAGWIVRHSNADVPAVLLTDDGTWHSYLRADAESESLEIRAYASPARILASTRLTTRMFARGRDRLGRRGARGRGTTPEGTGPSAGHSRVGVRYWHRPLSLDPASRSELFWVDPAELSPRDVVLCDVPPTRQREAGRLIQEGVAVVGQPSVPLASAARSVASVLARAATLAVRPTHARSFIVTRLGGFAVEYSRWTGFLVRQGIRVSVVTQINGSVPLVVALRRLGGVSMCYQYAISNLIAPTALLTAGEDVQFVYSRAFADLWRSIGSRTTRYAVVGPMQGVIGGGARARWQSERSALRARGATFVLVFFDENSVPGWDSFFPHIEAARDYAALAEWVLEDPTLAVIVKPKRPSTLRSRLSSVREIVGRAEGTGRLIISGEAEEDLPGAVANAGDLCVGKLIGATAAFEAWSAGIPSVLVDGADLVDHPFYAWGAETVVFRDWPALRSALASTRRGDRSALGDWSMSGADLDAFGDGQGARRMGRYVAATLRALSQGGDRQDAVRSADRSLTAAAG